MTEADGPAAGSPEGLPAEAPPGRRGPYAKTAARRAAIVAAAREVFATHGYRSGSIQAVADACGISQSAVLHHFTGKEDLLLAVLADRDARGDDLKGDSGLVDGVLAQARHNESVPGLIELYTTLCGESTSPVHPAHGYFSERFARARRSFAEQFRELEAAGRLRDGVDPELAGASLVALWEGAQLQWLMEPGAVDVVAQLRHFLALTIVPEWQAGRQESTERPSHPAPDARR